MTKTQFLWEGEGYKTILKQILCKLCKAIEFQRTPWEILQEGIWSAKIEAEEGGGVERLQSKVYCSFWEKYKYNYVPNV